MSDLESQGPPPSSDPGVASQPVPVTAVDDDDFVIPATPQDTTTSIPSTQGPGSPADPNASFKTELNDDRDVDSAVITSSLTPPPSSQQVRTTNSYFALSQRPSGADALFTPPVTALNAVTRDTLSASDYVPPSDGQLVGASADELRTMLRGCLAENSKLKTEAAHYKFQYQLLSMQANEDATRAAIEQEITRRQVDILKQAESSRQARSELADAAESAQLRYHQLKQCYEELAAENHTFRKRLRSAKKVIQAKDEEVSDLCEERDLLLNRIRENREHFQMLCSPGGIFHSAMSPKSNNLSSPQQNRAGGRRHTYATGLPHRHEKFDALLQVLSHEENNSAPSTPFNTARPPQRNHAKHTRAVQSLSSLPTTPNRPRHGEHGALLPSIDLVPQTEPPRRYTGRLPEAPSNRGRQSRESTISAEDTEELARQALQVATQSSFLSQRSTQQQHQEEEEVFESQASQAASEMLRRDPRESFEVASSVGSRDATPAPAEKTAKLQARLFGGINKNSASQNKRQISGSADIREAQHSAGRGPGPSPSKKARVGGMSEARRVGLGIQYSQDS